MSINRPPATRLLALVFALLCLGPIRNGQASDRIPLSLGVRALNSQPNARVMLHIVPGHLGADSSAVCGAVPPTDCRTGERTFVTEAPLSSPEVPYYFAYVIVANYGPGDGFRGVQYGIQYDEALLSGVDILDWTSCSVLEFPMENWPHSGSGNLQTVFCQTSGMTVIGYFTISVFSPDLLDLVERPNDGALKVADCEASETLLPEVSAGAVGFGSRAGQDPCFELADLPPDPPPVPTAPLETRFMLHAVPAVDIPNNRCSDLGSIPCSEGIRTFVTEAPLLTPTTQEYLVYLLIKVPYPEYGVNRACFAVNFDPGLLVRDFVSCASIDERYYNFPATRGESCQTWYPSAGACTPSPMTIVGYFRVEARSAGRLRLGREPQQNRGVVTYCVGEEQELIFNDWVEMAEMAEVGFGGSAGYDPCFESGWEELSSRIQVSVQPTTWGAIKALMAR